MSAPLRQGELAEATVVPVALGERAYDIAIGRGLLASLGADITVLPASATTEDVMRTKPHGVLLSNGPGTISAQGAKGAVSADGPEDPERVQLNKALIGFLTNSCLLRFGFFQSVFLGELQIG